MAAVYRFVSRWRLEGRCENVADILEDVDAIARWWPSVYRACRVLERGGEHGLGRVVEVTTKGFLPYLLRWTFVQSGGLVDVSCSRRFLRPITITR
jgi:hypothetical protein